MLTTDSPLSHAAAQAGVDFLDAIDILDRPHVRERLAAARDAARKRFEARAADAAVQALTTLATLATTTHPRNALWGLDEDADRAAILWAVEQRRAASMIIRAATAYQRAIRVRPHSHRREKTNVSSAAAAPPNLDAERTPSVVVEDSNDTSPARAGEEAVEPSFNDPRPLLDAGRWPNAAGRTLTATGALHPP